jgi:hypothetical protein
MHPFALLPLPTKTQKKRKEKKKLSSLEPSLIGWMEFLFSKTVCHHFLTWTNTIIIKLGTFIIY